MNIGKSPNGKFEMWRSPIVNIEAVIFDKDGTLANSHEYLRQVAVQRLTSLANMISYLAPADFTAQLLQAWGLREGQVHPSSMLAVGSRRDNEIVTAGFVATLDYDWIAALSLAESAFAVAAQAFPSEAENDDGVSWCGAIINSAASRQHQTRYSLRRRLAEY